MRMLYKEFLKNIRKCPFCERKDFIFKENEHAYLTFSLAPYTKDHLLAIPKTHAKSFADLKMVEYESVSDLLKIGSKILEKLGYDSSTILVRSGNNGARSVEHLHFHIVPEVLIGDLNHIGRERSILEGDEIQDVKKRVEKAVSQL